MHAMSQSMGARIRPGMRIRKLARELSLSEQDLLGILTTMGHARYVSAEQMLPREVADQVRRHKTPPPRPGIGWRPAEPREIRDLDRPQPGSSRAKAPPPTSPRPVTPATVRRPVAPSVPVPAPALVPAPLPPAEPQADLKPELERARERIAALEQEVASLESHRSALIRAQAVESDASGAEPRTSVRAAFVQRGLVGDDEIVLAVRAWADARRLPDLLDTIQLADPAGLQSLLDERMLLVGPGEDAPAGVAAVTVAQERSERNTAPAVRGALSRMATALLVQGRRRLVVHGGAAAWQRELKEGLDPRIDLRFHPHAGIGPLPGAGPADVVVLWDTAVGDPKLTERHPDAILIPQRGLIPFCRAVVDGLGGG